MTAQFLKALVSLSLYLEVQGGELSRVEGAPLAKKFFAEYPLKAPRLELATQNIHGTGKWCWYSGKNPEKIWLTFEFFKAEEKRRLDWIDPPRANRKESSKAILATPLLAAEVINPHTPFAYVSQTFESNRSKLDSNWDVMCARFLHGGYECMAKSVLARIKDGSWVVTKVQSDNANPEWIVVSFDYAEKLQSSRNGLVAAKGKVEAVFSPVEDWFMRQLRIYPEMPITTITKFAVSELLITPTGFVPKSIRWDLWKKGGDSGDTLLETTQFELEHVENIPGNSDAPFTLEALGVAVPPRKQSLASWWWLAGIGIIAVAAAAYAMKRRRANLGK